VASNGQQKGVMAGSIRLATLNDKSGQQTTKHKAGTDATTNHQQESGRPTAADKESKRTVAGDQQ